MFNDIAIIIEKGNPPRFRLAEDGAAPRITTAAVMDMEAERPVWWLVPSSFTEVHSFTTDVSSEEVESLADAEPFDPIEDLPPSDPRHQEAIAMRDLANEHMSPILEWLTYGVVPSGFRQAAPDGDVAPLVRGRSYSLSVMGPGGHGQLTFHV